ncbi:PucR family transcriptional regulator [Arsenicicoccus sp. oral taxon 190]|uniref:PucR family transcriptional regulator n=1 Tax=Arsenicicoccus sp. oral taxon 190 TaxID=1658671 RepID=UPI00067A39D6|nr:helix-turn-helix domain-containing protein [Arsenicicoccus sp. oral taxon 190]AKT51884.1 hypothetical protein ADJ73_12455 [Arsenicicoccus sp. oral taxon 190]
MPKYTKDSASTRPLVRALRTDQPWARWVWSCSWAMRRVSQSRSSSVSQVASAGRSVRYAARRHVRWQLGPLLDRDADTGSDLVDTLGAYLAEGRSHSAAAQRLGIHANTLYQRLHRIDRLLGPGWREPSRVFELQLALELHRLGRSHPGRAAPR